MANIGLDLTKQEIENAVNYVNDNETELEHSLDVVEGSDFGTSVDEAGHHLNTALGYDSHATGDSSVSFGVNSHATGKKSIAIGRGANAYQDNSIQIGQGNNNTANTVKIKSTVIVGADDKIPASSVGNGLPYSGLSEQPQINGNILADNKTSAQLGLQDKLQSGVNLKTVNGTSLLGNGDIQVGFSDVPTEFYVYSSLLAIYNDTSEVPNGTYQNVIEHAVSAKVNGENTQIKFYKDSIICINRTTQSVSCFGQYSFVLKFNGTDGFTGGEIASGGGGGDCKIHYLPEEFYDYSTLEEMFQAGLPSGIYTMPSGGTFGFEVDEFNNSYNMNDTSIFTFNSDETTASLIGADGGNFVYHTSRPGIYGEIATTQFVRKILDETIGDIETALQDLHTALQGLISGGGVE